MKILLTGATGYIGKRLLPKLIDNGHHVVCCVRDLSRFTIPPSMEGKVEVLQIDFLDNVSEQKLPEDIDVAYYLIHSMSSENDFVELEKRSAENFRTILEKTKIQHVLYLTGIANEQSLSPHLSSRLDVENVLAGGAYNFTALRAGIIIGSGSASFEIIRDLAEKLPIMITPKWLNTQSQPIGVNDVLEFLTLSMLKKELFNKSFDIGGPDVLSYKDILLGYAKVIGLRRYIITVPVMTPKISSYWLYFITSTSFKLASALVDSMKVEVVCRDNQLNNILGIHPESFIESVRKTIAEVQAGQILSSWKDSFVSSRIDKTLDEFLSIPSYGCFTDKRNKPIKNFEKSRDMVWKIGGDRGWYYADWLWKIRGFLDKLFGGVGLRRGRTNLNEISNGDVIDFWRVLDSNKNQFRLLLFAEMKLPGEAWLEFKVVGNELHQTATFRPKGLLGRIYWYAVLPFHGIIFKGLLNKLTN